MWKRCMSIFFLCFLMFFVTQGMLFAAQEEEGYFLDLKQKGQLISLGLIQDKEGVWYNVWICPGYVPPFRYAKKYFYKTGSDFDEYFHAQKYKDLVKGSKDAYIWAFDDCIHGCIIKGIPRAWEKYFETASHRTSKRVFGWWFSYPWAFMESMVESIVRLPVCLTGSVLGTGWATFVVPTYHMTDSSVKGVWHLSVNTITLPIVAGAWNTIISPPLSLVGQKPSLARVDGFWVRTITNEQALNMEYSASPVGHDDLVILEQWGIMLDKELVPYENEYAQVRNDATTAINKIRDDQREKEKKIDEKESQHVDNLMTNPDPDTQRILNLLSGKNFNTGRLMALRGKISEALQENNEVDKNRINHIINLLLKYPPSRTTGNGYRSYKTDPLRRSVEIMNKVGVPPEKPFREVIEP